MTARLTRLGLWMALAAGCMDRASAMDPDRIMSQYARDRWGANKGLAGEVRAITQTSDGYLWIGTDRGLFRFDGLSFRRVSDQGPQPSAIASVSGLALNDQGNLIVRLPERNLLRYADGAFENTLYSLQPRELAITAMCRGKAGDILATGLVHGVLRYSDGRFEMIAPVTALPPSPVISMTQSADGKIWLGTRDAGLFYVEGGRVIALKPALPSRKINALLSSGTDVWVGTDSGLVRWSGTRITSDGVPASLRGASVMAMLMDRQSNLWIGTNTGLFRMNAGGVSALDHHEPDSGGIVNALFEDREGSLWAGGPTGIERWRDSSFTTYGKPEGLPSDNHGPVYTDTESRTWFAPLEGGLYWLRRGERARVVEAGLGNDIVYSIGGNADGVWVGRQRGGLTHLYDQGEKLASESFTEADGLAQNSVYSVYLSRDGSVWAGTLSGGVSRLHNGRFTTYSVADGLASNTVKSILESADGTMWFATPNGLRALAKDKWRGYTLKEGLPSDDVNCVAEDSRGVLWIGTAAGLAFLSANDVVTPHNVPELLHEPVFGLTEDKGGWLWVVTSNHLVRVNRDKLLRGVLAEADVHEYTLGDGLRSVEGVRRDRSLAPDSLGRIWFSMTNGISVVDPARLINSPVPAIVQVQTVSADNNTVDLHGSIHIPAPPRRITFAYSGLSLWAPERVRFRYQLDGYESGWSEPTAGREAAYTNLGPGAYRFRVIASNPDGVWNPTETAIGFVVEPLFWQTWWFRVAALATAALAFLALYRLRLRQLTRSLNVRFEERLAERTRIAQELHDTLLQGFLSASMQLHVAVDNLPEDSPSKALLSRVLERMRQVIDEGRNAVRGLRSSRGPSLDLEQTFSQIAQELHISEDIGFRVIVEGEPRPLHPVLRDEVYRIGREALVNAFRHSQAKEVDLEIKYAAKQMRVLVRDNGCGIDPHVLESGREGHWGLPGMRERAEKIGGRLRVWSRAAAGTEVELSIPGHVAFERPPSGRIPKWLGRRNGGGKEIAR
jgi:signal transduction histidine kinase/ligand-binding sensor domain-containing protein